MVARGGLSRAGAALPPALRCTPRSPIDLLGGSGGGGGGGGKEPARLRGCAALCTGGKSQQAPFLYPPGPAPRCPRVPVFGGASVALSPRRGPSSVLPFQARVPRLQCRPAIPPLPADAAAHAPTAPSPRARVTAAAWTPECVAWCPHREGYVFGEECRPQYPGSAGRWPPEPPPEQAAAPHQLPGPRSPSLRAEKRRENFGRNFANFTLVYLHEFTDQRSALLPSTLLGNFRFFKANRSWKEASFHKLPGLLMAGTKVKM
ncbi:uncharacterized protein LOC110261350 [Sus scrofa]|uniref:uncharacterized protein LOC110261350 n=1 Tax=Sus scrofa TaxID=9823 RepID=UPI000A2B9156|nr:uncharacterized protein LOC110261350 [Sus scrofa]